MAANIAAYEQTVRSTIGLAATFAPEDWAAPTECPGWSVRDQVSHIVGVERWLLGEADPEHTLPAGLTHVRNDFGRALEVAVDVRRSTPGGDLLVELRDVLDRRLAALPDIDPVQQVPLPTGRMGTYIEMMRFRAFDCWTHEQDIRRAVHRPGNLAAPAAQCARDILTAGLPYVVAKKSGAAPGQHVVLEVTGPLSFTVEVVVGDDGRGRFAGGLGTEPAEPAEPAVTLRMGWEEYARLSSGRVPAEAAEIDVSGDTDLGRRIVRSMAITP